MAHDYSFSGDVRVESKLYEAWKTAMDVRKFEIELYWKRASYFWTFIGLALAGYGAVLTARKDQMTEARQADALFAIACVGLVFSVAWYFVNRGSKFWQRNWEYQVDILESKVIGPLYATVFAGTDDRLSKLTGAYPFSVSNINHLLSLFMIVVFILLGLYALPCIGLSSTCSMSISKSVIAAVAAAFCFALFYWGRTTTMQKADTADPSKIDEAPVKVRFSVRKLDHSK